MWVWSGLWIALQTLGLSLQSFTNLMAKENKLQNLVETETTASRTA